MTGVVEMQSGVSSDRLEAPVAIDPLKHSDWDAQLTGSGASFFHGTAWPRVLRETYGYEPVYFCRFSEGRLKQLLPVMEISSRWTGRRGVSLPFADSCLPLNSTGEDLSALYAFAVEHGRERKWRYFESRGCLSHWPGAKPSTVFFNHVLRLDGRETALWERLDGAARRAVKKAQHDGVTVESGSTLELVRIFYTLYCGCQRRHGQPVQPIAFFESIARHIFAAGRGFVAVAKQGQAPVAAAIFFHDDHAAWHQLGASDRAFEHLRPNSLLMWEAVKHCAVNGLAELHMGRTSLLNDGLRHFKLGFGAREERMEYARYDFRRGDFVKNADRAENGLNNAFRCLPLPLLRLAGRFCATF